MSKPSMSSQSQLTALLERARADRTQPGPGGGGSSVGDDPIVFLTGAGISQESGIPTFRGAEGYWQVGSKNYHPMELATRAAFEAMPDEVWSWYLYRRAVCLGASPNASHHAIAQLEAQLKDDMHLITQNVDGLHRRAGSTDQRSFYIHGDITRMRCYAECSAETYVIPSTLARDPQREGQLSAGLSDAERAALRCPACGALARPHLLWFDECYDEQHFRFESSLRLAERTRLLVVIGTTGATNLPHQIGRLVASRGAAMLVINPEPNPFSELAEHTGGLFLQGTAGEHVPALCELLTTGAS